MTTRVKKYHVRHYSTGVPLLDQAIHDLIDQAGITQDAGFINEIIITALKMREDIERGDLKMITVALKELRYALKVFYPFQHIRKVAIFGSARVAKKTPDYLLARDFAKEIVKAGWMVITGAASGIMNAGNEGAGRENSFGVNIRLPFEQEANEVIADDAKLINFKYFFTRKLIFMKESDATVLFPGGFGTHDEGFETLTLIQTGKATPRPIVCVDPPGSSYWSAWRKFLEHQMARRQLIDKDDLKLIHYTHDPKEAVRFVSDFYRLYHSCRYIQDQLVIRLKHPLSKEKLKDLNRLFKNLLIRGTIKQYDHPFEEEANEPHTQGLTRLALYFNRRHFARLQAMIHEINQD